MTRTAAALTALMISTAPLCGQEQPWCVKLDAFTRNCAFATQSECLAVARNANGPATGLSSCIHNPDVHAPETHSVSPKGRTKAAPH